MYDPLTPEKREALGASLRDLFISQRWPLSGDLVQYHQPAGTAFYEIDGKRSTNKMAITREGVVLEAACSPLALALDNSVFVDYTIRESTTGEVFHASGLRVRKIA